MISKQYVFWIPLFIFSLISTSTGQTQLNSENWLEFKEYLRQYDSLQAALQKMVAADPELQKNPAKLQQMISADEQQRINGIYQGMSAAAHNAATEFTSAEGLPFDDLRTAKIAAIASRKIDKALLANTELLKHVDDEDSVRTMTFDNAKFQAYLKQYKKAEETAEDIVEEMPAQEQMLLYNMLAKGYAQAGNVEKGKELALKTMRIIYTYTDTTKQTLQDLEDTSQELAMVDQYAAQQYLDLLIGVGAEEKDAEKRAEFIEEAKDIIDSEGLWKQIEQVLEAKLEEKKTEEERLNSPAAKWDDHDWLNTDSKELSLETLKGKVVIIDFFATWCGPCIKAFPHLKKWQKEFEDQGLVIVGLTNYQGRFKRGSVTPEEELVKMKDDFIPEHKITWPVGIESEGRETFVKYGVQGIPHLVLVGRNGKVRYIKTGAGDFTETEEKIKELIAEK